MLIHGRLHLTSSGFNLDEVRSLLQKSLRRKERDLILKSCKELIGRGKDQLPWKSLVTFLYEDHCLSDAEVVKTLWKSYEQKSKYRAVELLLQAFTSRYAACLPVVALREMYHPSKNWDTSLEVEDELKGLVTKKSGCLDFDLALAHIRRAWKQANATDLIAYMKLATMAQDYEGRTVTEKGVKYLITGVACPNRAKGKPTPGLVVLSVLHKTSTTSAELKEYLMYSFKLASLPDVCVRLVLCATVTQLIHQDKVKKIENMQLGQVKWEEVGKLQTIPDWAVDKHTFRGKNGKGTKHIVKKKPNSEMSEEEFDNFHGERKKRGLADFFEEGTIMTHESAPGENPYWEETKKIYFEQPPKLQKTYRLTSLYYQKLKKEHKQLLYVPTKKLAMSETNEISDDNDENQSETRAESTRLQRKRAATASQQTYQKVKKRKVVVESGGASDMSDAVSSAGSDFAAGSDFGAFPPKGPLLQLPTGSAKVYTRLSADKTKVWKGPYRKNRMNLVLFYHKAMKNVLGDPHTLEIESKEPYLVFPVLKGATVTEIKITTRDFTDAISRAQVKDGEFVLRESLGVVQCHKMGVEKLKQLPVTFWVHFVWRFCLNVGDTGLYNAVTDNQLSFVFGIDMEEQRARVAEKNLVGFLFCKMPAKAYVQEIWNCLRAGKEELQKLVNKPINYAGLDRLAQTYDVSSYDRNMFIERIKLVRQAVQQL